MLRVIAAIVATLVTTSALAQAMSGISVGDTLAKTSELGIKPTFKENMGPFLIQKWRLGDGNDLSITAVRTSGQIVYMETNWGGKSSGAFSDVNGMVYGKTTLAEIRKRFGSNGFAYRDRGTGVELEDSIALFNSYELEGHPGLVATFITRLSHRDAKAKKPYEAKLDTIIVGHSSYLDTIWGDDKVFDDDYQKIKW